MLRTLAKSPPVCAIKDYLFSPARIPNYQPYQYILDDRDENRGESQRPECFSQLIQQRSGLMYKQSE